MASGVDDGIAPPRLLPYQCDGAWHVHGGRHDGHVLLVHGGGDVDRRDRQNKAAPANKNKQPGGGKPPAEGAAEGAEESYNPIATQVTFTHRT